MVVVVVVVVAVIIVVVFVVVFVDILTSEIRSQAVIIFLYIHTVEKVKKNHFLK